jgi:hypothetical protein
LIEELDARQNLLPEAPLIENLRSRADDFAAWASGQLRSGLRVSPHVVVSTRKAGHGVRPVPITGIVERVVYRALSSFVLRNLEPVDRSPEAYLAFAQAPIYWAREISPEPDTFGFRILNSDIKYVVKSDITAFYQYVDHSLLQSELLNLTGEFDAVEGLVEFLGELQGRGFGLPQLLDPSDWLSEYYIDIVSRDMLRRDYSVWRFNDDFRIATRSYPEALSAIEALDASARAIGLTLNEYKTLTIRYTNYVFDTMGLQVDDALPDQLDVESAVADYAEIDETEAAETSLQVVRAAFVGSDDEGDTARQGDIDLRRISAEGFRSLRRALGNLGRVGNPGAVDDLRKLLIYAPSLTPRIATYLMDVVGVATIEVRNAAAQALAQVSLSDWQVQWLVRVGRSTDLFLDRPDLLDRLRTDWRLRGALALEAECVLALAEIGQVEVGEVDQGLRLAPAAIAPWFLAALDALHRQGIPAATAQRLAAVRSSTRLSAWLLPEP